MEPEANFYEEFKRLHPKPYFSFPDIPDYKGYSFEKLNIENFKQLYLLFEDDDSNFVDERFHAFIAATALNYKLPLISGDSIFKKIQELDFLFVEF